MCEGIKLKLEILSLGITRYYNKMISGRQSETRPLFFHCDFPSWKECLPANFQFFDFSKGSFVNIRVSVHSL